MLQKTEINGGVVMAVRTESVYGAIVISDDVIAKIAGIALVLVSIALMNSGASRN